MKNIRNFSIIAHIDHGKSTFADQLIKICGGISSKKINSQILDSMDLERERGITIKSQSVTLNYKSLNGQTYQLNFIDTPGHVDFSYEVSRSLYACEGAVLLIDSTQGVEAQTQANCYMAINMNLSIVSILSKIDLPSSNVKRIIKEVKEIIGIPIKQSVCCSAKTGFGMIEAIEHLIKNIPPPKGDPLGPLKALIIDSWFDNYHGVVSLIRIKNGTLKIGDKIKIMSNNKVYNVEKLGVFIPKKINRNVLNCGEVGWLICSIKNVLGAPIGDTITLVNNCAFEPLPNFKKIKPQPKIFAGLFPLNNNDYSSFSKALKKLSLNDSSIFFEPENSEVLGFGFRCGFLGILHMEIVKERLEREYNIKLIITSPTVIYELKTINNEIIYIDNPSKIKNIKYIKEFREPILECKILIPHKFLGSVIKLCIEKRGIQTNIHYYEKQVYIHWEIPMMEIVFDFFNRLKSNTNGYASINYIFKCFKPSEMLCVDILINHNKVDALSLILHKKNARNNAIKLVEKIKKLIPRHQFDIIIQASIKNKIVARATINQLRKNVLAKCYGGDVSRKKKLLQKQKKGKKRMKKIGNVLIPQEVFFSIFKIEKNN